ncbi:hypothetical protein [Pseudobutyrivibrio sp.]|uniref:hypothetical protein n=1 Tax=Pseudobutyrivibrio sp. TaxID=2014367 RepID=UPI001D7C53F1|nr:hypothetical protein [Pseudobutyrivibrio sp.]MBE5911668.1 hypothetical protein [Pseudobutyrivibrio sp.]
MLDKLEKKFGKYAINNLIIYLLGGYIIGYLLQFGQSFTGVRYLDLLKLEPYLIINNLEIWRIFTWVLIPPSGNPLILLIMFLLYYQLGGTLERTWGTFKFNVYIFGGIIFTIIAAFVSYFMLMLQYGDKFNTVYQLNGGMIVGNIITTENILMTIFLAFAVCFPDMQILLYFIIPIKMKWMAIFYLVIIGYNIISYITAGAWCVVIPVIASLLNFVIFYFSTRNMSRYNPKEIHRRAEFRRQATPPRTHYRDGSPISKHKCAVCGRTELTNPELEFRFCSKCNGNYEYCSDHLFTHNHVK